MFQKWNVGSEKVNMGILQYKTTLNRHRSPVKLVWLIDSLGSKIVTCGFGGPPMHRSRDTAHAQ